MQLEIDTDTNDDERKTNNHHDQGQNADGHNQLPATPVRRSGRQRRQLERYEQPLSCTLYTQELKKRTMRVI